MKHFVTPLLCLLGCSFAMLHRIRSVAPPRSWSRPYSTGVTRYDAGWNRNQLVRPHLHKLACPLASAIKSSSWYCETDAASGASVYLKEYSKYYRILLSVHAMYLVQLPVALRDQDQEGALKRWVTDASICTTQIGLSTKSVQLLQVRYLQLLVLAKSLNEEERLAVAAYIDEKLPALVQSHKQEIYQIFIQDYHRAADKRGFLEALTAPFVMSQIKLGIDMVLHKIVREVSGLDLTNFTKLWAVATSKARSMSRDGGQKRSDTELRLFMLLAVREPDLQKREALIKAAVLYVRFAKEIEEIAQYLLETEPKPNPTVKE